MGKRIAQGVDIIQEQLWCSRIEASMLLALGIFCLVAEVIVVATSAYWSNGIVVKLLLLVPPIVDGIIISKWYDKKEDEDSE